MVEQRRRTSVYLAFLWVSFLSIYESIWNKELKKQMDINAETVSLRLGRKRPDMRTHLPYLEHSWEDFEQRGGQTSELYFFYFESSREHWAEGTARHLPTHQAFEPLKTFEQKQPHICRSQRYLSLRMNIDPNKQIDMQFGQLNFERFETLSRVVLTCSDLKAV